MKKNNIYIIAEAGINHNGELDLAKEMILSASKAGANCIKFQAFTLTKLLTKNTFTADYQKANTGLNSQWEVLKNLSFNKKDLIILYKKCAEVNIDFLCTAFDEDWLEFLVSIGMKKIKVPSGEITNHPYLSFAAKFNLPIILSTGMSNDIEIKNAINVIRNINSNAKISILHCTSLYPAKMQTLNLLAIKSLKRKFKTEVGYSDHSLGETASLASIGLGARIIEKHFTLNKKLSGPDHKASLSSSELKSFIKNIRDIEKAMGNGIKTAHKLEFSTLLAARKSWHANKNIKKGIKLTYNDLILLRPGNGILGDINITGLEVLKDIKRGEILEKKWLKK